MPANTMHPLLRSGLPVAGRDPGEEASQHLTEQTKWYIRSSKIHSSMPYASCTSAFRRQGLPVQPADLARCSLEDGFFIALPGCVSLKWVPAYGSKGLFWRTPQHRMLKHLLQQLCKTSGLHTNKKGLRRLLKQRRLLRRRLVYIQKDEGTQKKL